MVTFIGNVGYETCAVVGAHTDGLSLITRAVTTLAGNGEAICVAFVTKKTC